MTTSGVRRASPPQAVQKIRDNVFLVQLSISASPSGDWRRLFYDAQQDVPPDFAPRSIEITGTFLRFKSDPASVEQKVALLDRWMERASQKETAMAGRSEGQRQKMEEMAREAEELSQWNERWAKL
ncbi:MAG TPA: hypothetical protein VJN69_07375 [Candidatus Acidoferrales bacterium]|nr:hypothetical protein [Candidatus Acidoferrales bacterium]